MKIRTTFSYSLRNGKKKARLTDISISLLYFISYFTKGLFINNQTANLEKDAGLGVRATATVNAGSFLEKIILRLDVTHAINEPGKNTQVWFEVNHAL